MKLKKGQLWISAVLYLLIISIVIAIVLEAGIPMLNNLRDKSVTIQTRDNFINIDQHIQEISNAGPGSQRVVPIEVKKGDLEIAKGRIRWSMDTEADIMQPGTSQKTGNIRVGLNADVSAVETNDTITLENTYVKIIFNKIGNESSFQSINSTGFVKYMQFVETGAQANGTFAFEIDDTTLSVNGYSKLLHKGFDLQKATVRMHINQTATINDIYVSLHANEDFLRVEME